MKNHVNYIALINLRLTEDMLKDMLTKGSVNMSTLF